MQHRVFQFQFPPMDLISDAAAMSKVPSEEGDQGVLAGFVRQAGTGANSSQAGSEAASKRSKSKHEVQLEQEVKRLKDLVVILSKLSLSSHLQVRTFKSIIVQCMEVLTESGWVETHKEGTGEFTTAANKMRENGKNSKEIKQLLGIPGVHGFNKWVKKYIKEKKPGYALMEEAAKLWATEGGWQIIAAHIKHCKITRMFHSTSKRLEVSCPLALTLKTMKPEIFTLANITGFSQEKPAIADLTPSWAWVLIEQEITKDPAFQQHMEGIAPMGDLERKVQEYLDSCAEGK